MPIPRDAASVLRSAGNRHWRGVVAGWAAGAAAFVVAVIVWKGGKAAHTSQGDFAALAGASLAVGSIWIGYTVYLRLASAPGLVVWLRRFRPGYGDRIRFHSALGNACFGLASPVTLRDRSFGTSMVSAGSRLWFLAPFIGVVWIAGAFAVLVGLFIVNVMSAAIALLALLGWSVLFGWGVVKLLRWRGVVSRDWTDVQVARHLDEIRRGDRRVGKGVEVVKVAATGDEWQKVVAAALSRADVAVIDISEVTKWITWEVGQALGRLGPDRVLLVAEEGSVNARALAEQFMVDGVSGASIPWIEHVLLFYPAAQGELHKRRSQYATLVASLRREIAKRLAASRPS